MWNPGVLVNARAQPITYGVTDCPLAIGSPKRPAFGGVTPAILQAPSSQIHIGLAEAKPERASERGARRGAKTNANR